MRGWLYILSTNRPGVVKIGMTAWSPELRAEQLATEWNYAALAPFRVVWAKCLPDMEAAERATHHMLRSRRTIDLPSEAFHARADEAVAAAEAVSASMRRRYLWGRAAGRAEDFLGRAIMWPVLLALRLFLLPMGLLLLLAAYGAYGQSQGWAALYAVLAGMCFIGRRDLRG